MYFLHWKCKTEQCKTERMVYLRVRKNIMLDSIRRSHHTIATRLSFSSPSGNNFRSNSGVVPLDTIRRMDSQAAIVVQCNRAAPRWHTIRTLFAYPGFVCFQLFRHVCGRLSPQGTLTNSETQLQASPRWTHGHLLSSTWRWKTRS